MSGTTADGWPYVTPDDHPLEFPAASQALANKLQATQLKEASGTFIIPNIAAGGVSATIPITFPVGLFTKPPVVMVSTGSHRYIGGVMSVTAEGASLLFGNWSPATPGAAINGYWLAQGT